MDKDILLEYVRPVKPEERDKLPKFSYSKLDVSRNCPFQYNKKYNEKLYPSDTSLPLELGNLCHYVLEQKGLTIMNSNTPDYDNLLNILQNGTAQTDGKTKRPIPGVNDIKKKYWETWYKPDDASGMNYEEKIKKFKEVLLSEANSSDGWKVAHCEMPFEFVWNNKVIIHGFIDRVDKQDNKYRVIDYKTSKKIYSQSKLATSLQFGIYALAGLTLFNELPEENIYRFILIDKTQYALTKGWEKRLVKIITRLFDQIEKRKEKDEWRPKPSPLCYWCPYCENNPDAGRYKKICKYYSLWTPYNKTFDVKEEWTNKKENKTKGRKLIF